MNCNGIRPGIFVAIYLMLVLLVQYTSGQQAASREGDDDADVDGDVDDRQMVTKGNLYGVFKRRLERFNNEMSLDADSLYGDRRDEADDESEGKRSTIRECLYEEFKKRLDKINNELSLDGEKVFDRSGRRTPFKDARSIKSKLDDDPHTPIKEDLYESRKRLDKATNELHLRDNNNNVNQRNERSLMHVVDEDYFRNNDFSKLHPERRSYDNFDSPYFNTYSNNNNNDNYNYNSDYIDEQLNTGNFRPKLIRYRNIEPSYKSKLSNLRRRNAQNSTSKEPVGKAVGAVGADSSPSYPTVLTKALEANMNPSAHVPPATLLATVAKKLNTTTLNLAQKLTEITDIGSTSLKNDPQLTQLLQKYIENTVNLTSSDRQAKQTPVLDPISQSLGLPQPLPNPAYHPGQGQYQPSNPMQSQSPYPAPCATQCSSVQPMPTHVDCNSDQSQSPVDPETQCNISSILDKVLKKLEKIQQEKNNGTDDETQPEGAPCDVFGSWNSYVVGLRFDIGHQNLTKKAAPTSGELENITLCIEVQETNPPKRHEVLDTHWKFTGNSMKQIGGPFFIISEKRTENVLATFAGFCRTCGGIDTIFGSWTFVFPSKDCQDITVSIETKRDILRRSRMELKRKERFKEILFDKNKSKNANETATTPP